jgi:hypothetical protein
MAWPMQNAESEQNSHYALVKALSHGTATVDASLREIGGLGTVDVHRHRGHTYSNKPPGFAALATPADLVLRSAGARTHGDPQRMVWALHLWAVVLPALALLFLVRHVAERLEPGYGTAAAVVLGLGTLVLPFATLLYAHVLAATLLFASFALIWHVREGQLRLLLLAGAGALAGLAITTEYQSLIGACLLGLYALARTGWWRALAYGAGLLAGVAPLLLYNWWAFHSLTQSTYGSGSGHQGDAGTAFGAPTMHRLEKLTLFSNGLLPAAPVLACSAVGLVLLYRRGRRADALLLGAIPLAYLVFYTAYRASPFLDGPRLLIVTLPFLAVPLGLAFRAFPLTTTGLALMSIFRMVAVTATFPLAAYDGHWLDRLISRTYPLTAASLVGITGWYSLLPFFLAAAAAVVCAAAATTWPRLTGLDLGLAALALAGWALLAANASGARPGDKDIAVVALAVAAVLLLATVALAAVRTRRSAAVAAVT